MSDSAPKPQAKKKTAKKFQPNAMHLIEAYDTIYKLSFLLNKKKCLTGNPKAGFTLRPAMLGKLQSLANDKHELEFLPGNLYETSPTDPKLQAKLNDFVGYSVLGFMATPIRIYTKQLLEATEDADVNDNSQENIMRMISLFQKPIKQSEEKEGEQAAKGKITPYMLVQQIQKHLSMLRQRFMLELEVLHQLRRDWITSGDCFHALMGTNPFEVKGRMMAAQEIWQALQGMLVVKKSNFSGEFHPKITLERAIQNMMDWGPGTPPRMFTVRDDPSKGKIISLNEKLREQLTIFNNATRDALGAPYHSPSVEELIEKAKGELLEYYSPNQKNPTSEAPADVPPEEKPESSSDEESDTYRQKAKQVLADKDKSKEDNTPEAQRTGPESIPLSNALNYDELLQFYAGKEEDNPKEYLSALFFEANSAKYMSQYMLTVSQAQDLRGIYATMQTDLSYALDLYLIESKRMVNKLKSILKKLNAQPNPEEMILIAQPGEKTRTLMFKEAVRKWTRTYTEIAKKYLMLENAIQTKLVSTPKAIETVCQMETKEAVAYMEQLRALIRAQEKGYISEEQKERYLDPEQTSEVILRSIMAFFGAIEKYNYTDRCEEMAKGFRQQVAHYEELVEQNSSKAKTYKDLILSLQQQAESSETSVLIPELLNAEFYDMEPDKVDVFMERMLVGLEAKLNHLQFWQTYAQAVKDLSTKLSGADIEVYEKLFYAPKESGQVSLLGSLNLLNGTPEACEKNIYHHNDNTILRECVLRSFNLPKSGIPNSDTIDSDNVQDILGVDDYLTILIEFQNSFLLAIRKVFALDAETKRSEDQTNELQVPAGRVTEMRNQCECIMDKQVPISFALEHLISIWITLKDPAKLKSKEAEAIEKLKQKLDGNPVGGPSLYKRLGKNPDNVEIMADYLEKARAALAKYRKTLEGIAERLRNLNKQTNIPPNILEYQRQILSMERSIHQSAEELKEGTALRPDLVMSQIEDKKQRIHKYKKILHKFQKENPDVQLPSLS
ncbi:MAG: hypothetical protein HQM14_04800 [SAR324 cluster bacterium]|nr:hypothetical protein [SAR324 cluster bacterium]